LITLWLPEEEYQSVIIIETLQKKNFFSQLCHESPTSFIVSRPLHIVCAVQKPCRVEWLKLLSASWQTLEYTSQVLNLYGLIAD